MVNSTKWAPLAVEEINQKGGIAGAKVEMEFRDSTMKADDAIKNARYFVDSCGADYLAGIDSSGQILALAPIIEKLDKVLMVTHAATEKLTEEWVYKKGVKQIFRICNATYHDGYAAAFIAKDLPAMKWATISPQVRIRLYLLEDVPGNAEKGETRVSPSWPNPGPPPAPRIFGPISIRLWMPSRMDFIPPNGPGS